MSLSIHIGPLYAGIEPYEITMWSNLDAAWEVVDLPLP